jgi:hypothetical protein
MSCFNLMDAMLKPYTGQEGELTTQSGQRHSRVNALKIPWCCTTRAKLASNWPLRSLHGHQCAIYCRWCRPAPCCVYAGAAASRATQSHAVCYHLVAGWQLRQGWQGSV